MQQIFDKLILTSGNEQLGKFQLLCDAGISAFTSNLFLSIKKQKEELSHHKSNDQKLLFDFFGALNY